MSEPTGLMVMGVDSKGKTWHLPLDYLLKKLGLNNVLGRLDYLEKPIRKQRILDWLKKEEGKPRSTYWCQRHIPDFRWSDVWELLQEGKLKQFHSGCHPMLQVV